jgi:hypothetical protein
VDSEKEKFKKYFEQKLKDSLDKKTYDKLKNNSDEEFDIEEKSEDYENFRKENLPNSINFYEKLCFYSEKIINVAPDEKLSKNLEKEIFDSHLGVTPRGVVSLSILISISLMLIGLILLIFGKSFLGFGFIIMSLSSYIILQKVPSFYKKRLFSKANDEIIIAIFYIVAYMRFSSNFERAINFAANYLSPPLSLDFKRILWELENARYPNLKVAMDNYLEKWRDENLEFLEAIYLIESSLYESEEFRRISLLDKSLDIILSGNYEKMLHFAQELRGKVQTFNMIGIVLPILGLIILPLAASFGDPKSVLEVVIFLYNLLIPFGVLYFGFNIISNRPSSVNSVKPSKKMKNLTNLQKYKLKLNKDKFVFISATIISILIFITFFIIGLIPIIFHYTGADIVLNEKLGIIFGENSPFGIFQEYKEIDKGNTIYNYGPYGVYPALLSLFITLSFAFSIGYYLKIKYQNLINLRDKTKKLEKTFSSACFQLGNRINEGISAELAFGAVADTMKGTEAGNFFQKIDLNIKFENMSIEEAIFNSEKGAILEYPSDMIISSMKILIKAINNGPEITAKTLFDLSRYMNDIHMSNERLLDLLTESLGSMKSQAFFLAPLISGVVISIISLVTMILGFLSKKTGELVTDGSASGGNLQNFLGNSIPTYLFQSSIGIYLTILVIIIIYVVSNLENGEDPIQTKYLISQALLKGIGKYVIVVTIGIILFTYVGASVLKAI